MSVPKEFVSLGAGVQSSVMLCMADRGLIMPRPEAAVFADTGWEPPQIYQHLKWLTEHVDIPIHVTKQGDLYDMTWKGMNVTGQPFTDIPVYAETPDGARLSRRACTQNYKIKPVRRMVRKLLGANPRTWLASGTAVQWIGISKDEWHREKPSGVAWVSSLSPKSVPLARIGYDSAGLFAVVGKALPESAARQIVVRGMPVSLGPAVVGLDASLPGGNGEDRGIGPPFARFRTASKPVHKYVQRVSSPITPSVRGSPGRVGQTRQSPRASF